MPVPAYVAPFVLFANAAIIGAVVGGLNLALLRAAWPTSRRRRYVIVAAVLMLAWFGAAFALSYADVFRGEGDRWPTIQFGILTPIAIGLLFFLRSSAVWRVVDVVPQSWWVAIQTYRALGVIFVLLLTAGRLPAQFALPAGWGDIAVGISAPVVAFAYSRGLGGSTALVRAWNVFGLLDLAVAVGTGFLTSPSPIQALALDSPNELISDFPLVLVPVFAVPASVMLHVVSLAKLSRTHAGGENLSVQRAWSAWERRI